ncbi:Caspase-3 [Oopsacas minuta]|uniref:Caspase-3 n=1 Tax=Oopsacas minuta TaxID=111878 RepID=A0AAV7JC31_9METZ|nr:Caspase-3 [Oopsacas minuta]
MDFNKLFTSLSVQLSGHSSCFKNIKLQTERTLGIRDALTRVQLPSEFFTTLINYNKISENNLQPLYEIYEQSTLPNDVKFQAHKNIQEFNYYHFSFMATRILQQVILKLIKHPVDTNEMKGLVEWIPEEERTPRMLLDHSASLMKLIELRIIHAFDFRILHNVFMNNIMVTKTIIEPNWRQIMELNANYIRNDCQLQLKPQRPSNIRFHTPPGSLEPSPVEVYHNNQHTYPHTELPRINTYFSPEQPVASRTNPGFQNYPLLHHSDPSNYENPSPPPRIDSINEEVLYDIPDMDVLSGVFPGECLIINIERFHESSGIKDRIGSCVDVENIRKTFNALKYKVTVKNDLTSEQLIKYLKEKSTDESLYRVGMFVCFLMSHGEEGRISGSDGTHIEIETIITNFKNDQCYPLQGKPKIFFVQACRGNMVDIPKQEYQHDSTHGAQPQDADLMICQATTKGKVAVRTEAGSWYIKTLCDNISRGYSTLDFFQIHTIVNRKVSEMGKHASTLQVSNSSGSLRKTLKFFPNISSNNFMNRLQNK